MQLIREDEVRTAMKRSLSMSSYVVLCQGAIPVLYLI